MKQRHEIQYGFLVTMSRLFYPYDVIYIDDNEPALLSGSVFGRLYVPPGRKRI